MSSGGGNLQDCTAVGPGCPLSGTIYGYYPSLAGNALFLAINALCFGLQLVFGIRYKTWTYTIGVGLGCLLEVIGYVGRIMMHSNPYNYSGFIMQICCLILGPACLSAGIYLTLKHFTKAYGKQFSIIEPRLYTWIFITCDIISLTLQAAGGGISSTSNDDSSAELGNNLTIAGIVFQVFTLLMFGLLAGLYLFKRWRNSSSAPAPSAETQRTLFKFFIWAIVIAYVTIFIRCVYRIAEMADGWANKLMQTEWEFLVWDNTMVTIAVICLTAFHPGYCFPSMSLPLRWSRKKSTTSGAEKTPQYDSDDSIPAKAMTAERQV